MASIGRLGWVRALRPHVTLGLFPGSWALLMMPFSLVAPEIDKGTFDGCHNGRLTVPNLLLITSGRPAEID